MIRTLLLRLTDRLPLRIIAEGDRPYLERYYLATVFGWRFYIHRFVGSDPDRALHDHPWTRAASLRLAGRYTEETRMGVRRQRWLGLLTGDTFHRVILDGPRPVWTLFAHRVGHAKRWGFLEPQEDGAALFVPFKYLGGLDPQSWWKTAPIGRDEPRRMPAILENKNGL